jgi:hypothetical protein
VLQNRSSSPIQINGDDRLTELRLLPDQWTAWRQHLTARSSPNGLPASLPNVKRSALLWALPKQLEGGSTERLIQNLHAVLVKKRAAELSCVDELESWLAAATVPACTPAYGLECLAWCHALPRLAASLPAALWWQMLDHALGTARDAAAIELQQQPLVHQLLRGELPLTLAYLFPELKPCEELAEPARDALSRGLTELLDGEGLPHCRHLPLMRSLLACWTRAATIGKAMQFECFQDDARSEYQWLVHQTLRLMRFDGAQVLYADACDADCRDLMHTALHLTDDPLDFAIAHRILPGRSSSTNRGLAAGEKLPSAGVHSEWAEIAILRPQWDRLGPQLAIAFGDRSFSWELNAHAHCIWSGQSNPKLQVDGRDLEPQSGWEEICWHNDDDVDYIELEIALDRGWKIQRQILLARNDRFLLACDAVLGNEIGRLDYRCALPLNAATEFEPSDAACEGFLKGRRPVGRVLPLALGEWRGGHSCGTLGLAQQGLQLSQHATGQRLYVPLFVDLDTRRTRQSCTWRQLTVAAQLEIQSADVAVGYRVQVGKQQWLIYRSLAAVENRTVLGQNLFVEFFVGRFQRNGETTELLSIQ